MTEEARSEGVPPKRGRFGRFVLILIGVITVTQVPMLAFVSLHSPLPGWGAALIFAAINAQIIIRIRWLPRPDPPPPWFERYVIWGFFLYTMASLFFAPGVLVWYLLDLDVGGGWAWLAWCFVWSGWSCGIPYRRVAVRHVDVRVPGLPKAFHGLRIAHLTDLHVGPFVSERRLRKWIGLANAAEPDIVCLTGDLIAAGLRFIPRLEAGLRELKPKHGVYAIMGNHDYFGGGVGEALVDMHERLGHRILRNAHEVLERGEERLTIAGVDDTWRDLDDLAKALDGRPESVPVLLLAHDPDLFVPAAEKGVALQLSGHIHGGQLAIPFLGRAGSVLRPFGMPFIQGIYTRGVSTMYLSAGLGTTGAPVRIGMPSELPILRLSP